MEPVIELFDCPPMQARLTVDACKRNKRLAREGKKSAKSGKIDDLRYLRQAECCPGCPGVVALAAGEKPQAVHIERHREQRQREKPHRRISPRSDGAMSARNLDRLSPRQRECWELHESGKSAREIAKRVGLKVQTVHVHLSDARSRLGLQRPTQSPNPQSPKPKPEPSEPARHASNLAAREREVWELTEQGLRPTEIARKLGVSRELVKSALSRARGKLVPPAASSLADIRNQVAAKLQALASKRAEIEKEEIKLREVLEGMEKAVKYLESVGT